MLREAASCTDRILSGAGLPCLLVQSSTKYEATLNLATARVLAPSMPRRADEAAA